MSYFWFKVFKYLLRWHIKRNSSQVDTAVGINTRKDEKYSWTSSSTTSNSTESKYNSPFVFLHNLKFNIKRNLIITGAIRHPQQLLTLKQKNTDNGIVTTSKAMAPTVTIISIIPLPSGSAKEQTVLRSHNGPIIIVKIWNGNGNFDRLRKSRISSCFFFLGSPPVGTPQVTHCPPSSISMSVPRPFLSLPWSAMQDGNEEKSNLKGNLKDFWEASLNRL